MQEVKLALLSIPVYLCVAIMKTQQKSHTATKNADSSGHCPNFSTPCFGVSLPTDHPEVSLLTH